MKLTYMGKTYDCVAVEKKPNEITIHTGKVEDGEEIVYQIVGDIDFDAVVLEGGTWASNTAPRNIVAGEYVTIGGVLHKATENIPAGEPIIVGHNAIVTTVEEQLHEMMKGA